MTDHKFDVVVDREVVNVNQIGVVVEKISKP